MSSATPALEARGLGYVYLRDTPLENRALTDVTFTIGAGEAVAVIGPTGCGKSTLVQHFNALLRPTEGSMRVLGQDTRDVRLGRSIRFQVGLVFQFPETQIFEETVHAELAFGPRNQGVPPGEIESRLVAACDLMGLDLDALRTRSPFSLSGGEKRRVALASVLAMEPPVLVLDEPTAGLDPESRRDCIEALKRLHAQGRTLVLVSHELDVVDAVTERVLVLEAGRLAHDGTLKAGLRRRLSGLRPPPAGELCLQLHQAGWPVTEDVTTVEEAAGQILSALERRE